MLILHIPAASASHFAKPQCRAPRGWVLLEAQLGPQKSYAFATLSVRCRADPDAVLEIPLFVSPDGTVHELVRLPEDVISLSWQPPEGVKGDEGLRLRSVRWFERVLRMAWRIARIGMALPRELRVDAGLTLWRALRDLSCAYGVAGKFRVPLDHSRGYTGWIETFDTLHERDVQQIQLQITRLRDRPRFRIVVVGERAPGCAVERTLESLRSQFYADYHCTRVDPDVNLDASLEALNTALGAAGVREWIILLRPGDQLAPLALYRFALEISADPEATVLYADDDLVGEDGRRRDPRFKPDWSPTHFEAADYIGSAAAVRSDAAYAVGGLSSDCIRYGIYDLLLRVAYRRDARVVHVPAVLVHRASAHDLPGEARWRERALQAHFARRGEVAQVVRVGDGRLRVRYALPERAPLVSIVVPTRDAAELLQACVAGVLERTTYPRYELLVVDNASREQEALRYLAEIASNPRVRVLAWRKRFNYAAIVNFAARHAQGEILCLLNNDTEVISPDWLEEMVGHLVRPAVGVVGAKLLYPDGRVQHAGVTVGPGGCANHVHVGIGRNDPGYCGRALLAQEYSAVTAACLVTRTQLYRNLGGLDEKAFPVTFNDVDFCLRVQEAGYRVVFTPHAELVHHESATRGRDVTFRAKLRVLRELRYMRRRWRTRMRHDPYYNPNLSYRRPDFSLSEAPNVRKPWRGGA